MIIVSDSHYYKYCLRQLRARLSKQGAKFLFFRLDEYTVKGSADAFFDRLAQMPDISGTRIDQEQFVWSSGLTLGHASAYEAGRFTNCFVRVWADSAEIVKAIKETITDSIGNLCLKEPTFILDWHFYDDGSISSTPIQEFVTDAILDTAYPGLGATPAVFAREFLESDASVLVLQGPPGVGKTRLIRYIMGDISRLKKGKAEIMYTSDDRLLRDDRLFIRFLTSNHDAFVLEDADHLLESRAYGNVDLHRFLNIADGVTRAKNKKLIFSTNLPNLHDIDDAIVRPGRCFAHVKLDLLPKEQAIKCLQDLQLSGEQLAKCHELFTEKKAVSLASMYAFAGRIRSPEKLQHSKVA